MWTMAAPALTYTQLHRSLTSRKDIRKIYIIHGEEGYYIDRLTEDIIGLVDEDDRDFNLTVLYGADSDANKVMDAAKRYPMMADRQVVVLKEAQAMRADQVNRLADYMRAPADFTVLALVFRGAQAKGKDMLAAAKASGAVIFESKRLNERGVTEAIAQVAVDLGLNIEPKGMMMLSQYLGTNLAMIHNEMGKLAMILGKGATVTPESIERNIGISKDYNNFELLNAISGRQAAKAFEIVEYFKANPKANPVTVTFSTLFNYFCNLTVYHFTADKSPSSLMGALGLKSQWQLRNYETGARNYNAYHTIEIISALRRTDAMSKGMGSRQNEYDLLRDLVYHILTARGDIRI